MTSAAPARKPYRKAPPQHRETRHTLPTAPPPPAPQPDINQVTKHLDTPVLPTQQLILGADNQWPCSDGLQHGVLSDSELDISSPSSLECCISPPSPFSSPIPRSSWVNRTMKMDFITSDRNTSGLYDRKGSESRQTRSSASGRKHSPTWQNSCQNSWLKSSAPTATPKGILKQPASPGPNHTYDDLRKSKSVELLDTSPTRLSDWVELPPEQRASTSPQSLAPPSPRRNNWNWNTQVLEEKVRFSNFLDEITCQILSPAHLLLLGKLPVKQREGHAPHDGRCHTNQQGESADRTLRWDRWVASLRRPDSCRVGRNDKREKKVGPEYNKATRRVKVEVRDTKQPQRHRRPPSNLSLLSHKVGERSKVSCSVLPAAHLSFSPWSVHLLDPGFSDTQIYGGLKWTKLIKCSFVVFVGVS